MPRPVRDNGPSLWVSNPVAPAETHPHIASARISPISTSGFKHQLRPSPGSFANPANGRRPTRRACFPRSPTANVAGPTTRSCAIRTKKRHRECGLPCSANRCRCRCRRSGTEPPAVPRLVEIFGVKIRTDDPGPAFHFVLNPRAGGAGGRLFFGFQRRKSRISRAANALGGVPERAILTDRLWRPRLLFTGQYAFTTLPVSVWLRRLWRPDIFGRAFDPGAHCRPPILSTSSAELDQAIDVGHLVAVRALSLFAYFDLWRRSGNPTGQALYEYALACLGGLRHPYRYRRTPGPIGPLGGTGPPLGDPELARPLVSCKARDCASNVALQF